MASRVGSAVLAGATGAWLAIEDGVVAQRGDRDAPSRAELVGDVVFSPGFVDIQTNGLGAVDFWRADPEEWRTAGRRDARRRESPRTCPRW